MSTLLSEPVNEVIQLEPQRSSVNSIVEKSERDRVAAQTAFSDGSSWRVHSQAQLLLDKRDDPESQYYPLYQKFVDLRAAVEQAQFGIPQEFAYAAATWLGVAAQRHDIAENEFDTGGQETSNQEWDEVDQALATRYLIMNLGIYVEEDLGRRILSEISQEGPVDFTNLMTSDQIFEIVSKRLGENKWDKEKINALLNLARSQAGFEKEQWETHHIKDYVGFSDATMSLLHSFGYRPEVCSRATDKLVEACRYHDQAEATTEDQKEKVKALWGAAMQTLVSYYDVLLGGEIS